MPPTLPGVPPRFLLVLIAVAACATVIGRIAAVQSPFGPNDVSRWATIAALTESGRYEVGKRIENPDGTYRDLKPPMMIDVLLHPETKQFYSSKPPLLPTLLAGEMVAMKRVLGWQPATDSVEMLRVLLLTSNALPIALYLIALLLLLERLKASDRASTILMIMAGFGTLVTTFAVSLNNHVGATAGAGIALYAVARIWSDDLQPKLFALAGLAAGWTASQEVPALCLVAILAVPLFMKSRRSALAIYLPCALIPLGAFWLTNFLALGRPFYFYAPIPIWSKFAGSYWVQTVGIDRGETSSFAYLFHFTFGHHGVFSLTPIFLLSFAGMLRLVRRSRFESLLAVLLLSAIAVAMRHLYREMSLPLPIALAPFAAAAGYLLLKRDDMMLRLSAAATLLTFGFYVVHTQNYGGVSAGPRWLMWLIPLWLIAALPVLEDALASKKKTLAICAALAISIFSSAHSSANPWTHPWLYDFFESSDVAR